MDREDILCEINGGNDWETLIEDVSSPVCSGGEVVTERKLTKSMCYAHSVYQQKYGAFRAHLSIIDLLFNSGPESLAIFTHQKARN